MMPKWFHFELYIHIRAQPLIKEELPPLRLSPSLIKYSYVCLRATEKDCGSCTPTKLSLFRSILIYFNLNKNVGDYRNHGVIKTNHGVTGTSRQGFSHDRDKLVSNRDKLVSVTVWTKQIILWSRFFSWSRLGHQKIPFNSKPMTKSLVTMLSHDWAVKVSSDMSYVCRDRYCTAVIADWKIANWLIPSQLNNRFDPDHGNHGGRSLR